MGGAPRSVAILNGTLAAALGLGLRLWMPGLLLWAIGHAAAVWAAKRDPQFVDVVRRHLRIPATWRPEPMLNLAEYRKTHAMLADFLPWAALAAPGVVLNKDGSLPAHGAVPRP